MRSHHVVTQNRSLEEAAADAQILGRLAQRLDELEPKNVDLYDRLDEQGEEIVHRRRGIVGALTRKIGVVGD
ncbi:hypothetical protein F441_21351 [Phytophthora nicotianae CJ01A1]|uniref:Uncharacterized protein n=1 Tax=Phytophthora nicotianae CJ01A1 TaxID=1317063 RepID=W2VSZ3_PHYNI|nr:hypothetical protein F441_21351 [Phytophthora nicotianae CJ01A1]